MSTTPKTGITELNPSAANQAPVVNSGWAIVDQLLDRTVKDKDLATPPGSPADGDAYIVAGSPTGAWSGKASQIAYWRSSANAWQFIVPRTGWTLRVADELASNGVPIEYGYTGSAWTPTIATAAPSPVVSETTTSRVLSLADAGRYIRTTNGAEVTITVPPQSSVAWVADTEVHVEQAGVGQVSIAAGSGVTINRVTGTNAKTKGTYAVVSLKRVAADTWTLFGLLEASA